MRIWTPVLAQDPERLDHLVELLAEADHQARLGDDLVAAHLLGHPQHPAERRKSEPRRAFG